MTHPHGSNYRDVIRRTAYQYVTPNLISLSKVSALNIFSDE